MYYDIRKKRIRKKNIQATIIIILSLLFFIGSIYVMYLVDKMNGIY